MFWRVGLIILNYAFFCPNLPAQEKQEEATKADVQAKKSDLAPAAKVAPDLETLTFTSYKPIYFLFGNPDSKIQLSFKAKILRSLNLYLGYSQLMMWQVLKKSAPMRDLNYNPEFFYRIQVPSDQRDQWIDLGIVEHESNGVGGFGSRSWNRSSLRFRSRFKFLEDSSVQWSVKAWVPYIYDSEKSKEMSHYRGVWEINAEISNIFGSWFRPGALMFRFYPGGQMYINPLRGGQEIIVRAQLRWQQLLLPVMVQLFHGYAESLLDYDQETLVVRAGFGF